MSGATSSPADTAATTTTGGMTAVADAVRERRGEATEYGPAATLATLPVDRLEEITGALHAAADLITRWREEAEELRAGAPRGLRGIRHRLWADALEAAADDLLIVVEPVRRVRRPAPGPGARVPEPRQAPVPPVKSAVLAAVAAIVNAHNDLPVPVRAARASRFPFEVAQVVVNVVGPAAYDRALARARGLLLDRGDVDAAHALAELQETPRDRA